MNSKNRTALAIVATAGLAAVALLAVLRSGIKMPRRPPVVEIDRWNSEGGNIPEVSISSGEQGNIPGRERDL